jgi:hypothetical protein
MVAWFVGPRSEEAVERLITVFDSLGRVVRPWVDGRLSVANIYDCALMPEIVSGQPTYPNLSMILLTRDVRASLPRRDHRDNVFSLIAQLSRGLRGTHRTFIRQPVMVPWPSVSWVAALPSAFNKAFLPRSDEYLISAIHPDDIVDLGASTDVYEGILDFFTAMVPTEGVIRPEGEVLTAVDKLRKGFLMSPFLRKVIRTATGLALLRGRDLRVDIEDMRDAWRLIRDSTRNNAHRRVHYGLGRTEQQRDSKHQPEEEVGQAP